MHRHHHLFHYFPRSKRDLCVIRYSNISAADGGDDDDNAFVNDQLVLILKLDYYYNYLLSSWLLMH
jgi:hypothetical protein